MRRDCTVLLLIHRVSEYLLKYSKYKTLLEYLNKYTENLILNSNEFWKL